MKVCTYKKVTSLGEVKRLGVFFNETTIIDVNFIWQKFYERKGYFSAKQNADLFAPSSLSSFLKIYQEDSINKLKETVELFKDFSKEGILKTNDHSPLSFDMQDDTEAKLSCPLDKINVYRDFYIHEKHVKKGFEKRNEPVPSPWYEMPVYYKGATAGFIGNDEIVPWPRYSQKLDYELELGVVISKDGKDIKEKDAYKHIFGYTIFNDISARDIQKKEMQVRLGPAKGKDFCSIMGPVIVTADELGEEPNLLMTATVNGEEWSRGHSGDGNFTWAQMISHASNEEWILSTDFMGSGTVGTGCGLELDKWINPGDVLVLDIEKIGTLKNIIGTPNK